MRRKNIFETLAGKYDIAIELKRISVLFHNISFTGDNDATIEEIVDDYRFCDWKSRGSCLNCHDMSDTLGLC
ncbi:MAG: hypothetical protein LBT18_01385, partial [Endomicrobium sp.]|nr:hypothetical protein [Endomicrobium sp.]